MTKPKKKKRKQSKKKKQKLKQNQLLKSIEKALIDIKEGNVYRGSIVERFP